MRLFELPMKVLERHTWTVSASLKKGDIANSFYSEIQGGARPEMKSRIFPLYLWEF